MSVPRVMLSVVRACVVACALGLASSASAAQPAKPQDPAAKVENLRKAWMTAASRGDAAEAEARLTELIALTPTDAVARYNLVILQLRQGKRDEAAESLQRAVEWGFSDLRRIASDPGLLPLHDTDVYRGLMHNWSAVQDRILEGRIREYAKVYKNGYTLTKDEAQRLAFYAALSPAAVEEARAEIRNVNHWWQTDVLPEGTAIVEAEGDRPDPWVVVLLPSEPDFLAWGARTFGVRAGMRVDGVYDSDRKELVAQGIGSTLRHEYSHLVHWRVMSRLGQAHPMWIQEGLCSLPEDVQVTPGTVPTEPARYTVLPSWRTNTVKRMQQIGNLPAWSAIMAKDAAAFTGQRVLGNYAVARSIFLFLAQKGQLRAWWADYTRTFADDPSGAQSIARVMGKPLAQVEKDWRTWLKTLPEVAEAGRSSTVALPFDVEATTEGLAVRAPRSRSGRTRPGTLDSPMTRAGLRDGDILVTLDDQPVRDVQELTRVLGGKKDGDEVGLVYRRAGQTYTTRVKVAD